MNKNSKSNRTDNKTNSRVVAFCTWVDRIAIIQTRQSNTSRCRARRSYCLMTRMWKRTSIKWSVSSLFWSLQLPLPSIIQRRPKNIAHRHWISTNSGITSIRGGLVNARYRKRLFKIWRRTRKMHSWCTRTTPSYNQRRAVLARYHTRISWAPKLPGRNKRPCRVKNTYRLVYRRKPVIMVI